MCCIRNLRFEVCNCMRKLQYKVRDCIKKMLFEVRLNEKCAVQSTVERYFLMQSGTSNQTFFMQHLFGFRTMEIYLLTLIVNKKFFWGGTFKGKNRVGI